MNTALKTDSHSAKSTARNSDLSSAMAPELGDSVWSALMDGELPAEQSRTLLKNLRDTPEGKARFSTYCAIGDALRGHADIGHSTDFTQRVMAALENEPTILAPVRKPANRRPAAWLAAAAVGAITLGLWNSLPEDHAAVPFASAPASAPENISPDISPYLAAHQDFAQAVLTPTDMDFTQVSLAQANP
jgi:sigma-E factor negative regulatory protein RseA